MAKLSLKERIASGERVNGIFIVEMMTPNWGTLLDRTGCDFAVFDLEHGRFSVNDLMDVLPSFQHSRCSALVRVPTTSREYFQRPIDFGVAGFVVPMVDTAEQARQCVEFLRYPPKGRRGMGGSRLACRVFDSEPERSTDDNTLLAIQIETERGFANLDEILAVDGIDMVFIGNTDLSSFLQCPNDLIQGELRDKMELIIRKARARGIAIGGFMDCTRAIKEFGEQGLSFVAMSVDCDLIVSGSQTMHGLLPPNWKTERR